MTELETAILGAIARTRVERERPAAILAAIGETHVVIDWGRWERVRALAMAALLWRDAEGENYPETVESLTRIRDALLVFMPAVETMQPGDLDPIDPATEG